MNRNSLVTIICSLVLLAQSFSCNSKRAGSQTQTIKISGAWALYPMMVTWAEEYQKLHKEIRIDVSAGGAGKGVADVLADLADIGMVSRSLRQEEANRGAFFIPVVKDAVFPVLNKANPIYDQLQKKGMTRNQFVDLWINNKSLTWGHIAGVAEPAKVNLYTRSDACGAAETWAKYLGGQQEDLQGIAVYGDPGIGEAVRKDVLGIGYNNLGYAFDLQSGMPVDGLALVPMDINENGVLDSVEVIDHKDKAVAAILAGVYPSPPARDLNLAAHGSFKNAGKDFVIWILTDGQKWVDAAGYVMLAPEQIQQALAKVAGK